MLKIRNTQSCFKIKPDLIVVNFQTSCHSFIPFIFSLNHTKGNLFVFGYYCKVQCSIIGTSIEQLVNNQTLAASDISFMSYFALGIFYDILHELERCVDINFIS